MTKLHLLRLTAVGITTAALTISGASMSVAADTTAAQGVDRPATSTTSATAWKSSRSEVGTAALGSFSFSSGILATKGLNFVRGTVTVGDAGVVRVTSEVWVNNVYRGVAEIYQNGAGIPGTVGPGRVTLRNARIYLSNGTSYVDPRVSNAFYFRRDTFGAFKVRHRGKKVSMSIRAQVRASNGERASAGRAYVQYSKNGKWRHLKKVRLNSSGKGSYRYSTKSKRTYRLVVKKSTTVQGMTIKLRKL